MFVRAFLFVGLAGSLAGPANSLCIYDGAYNAKTTIQQEFRDSRWVVRARVLSAADGVVEQGKPDAGMDWTTYELVVEQAYKGKPATRLKFFTMRDSGGFYMDRPRVPLPQGHDVGGEYLLFLNPIPKDGDRPAAAADATFVNYNCGQSKAWSHVTRSSRRLLDRLAHKR